MAVKRDYYEVLGVPRDASDEEIKRSFRRAAQRHHPDIDSSDGAEQRFKELNEAYRVLSDRQRRTAYDMFGHSGVDGVGAGGFEGNFGGGFGPFGDIFDAFFGGAPAGTRGRRRVVAGADLRYDLTIEFGEAVSGVTREISFPTLVRCSVCEGSGAEPGSEPEKCPECNGTGEKRRVSQTILGQMVNITACPRCGGEGRIVSTPCATCRGDGRVREQRTLSVEVPAGIESGQRIAIEGQGEAGPRGGPPGDLYVAVTVREHPQLLRRGTELFYELPVTFPQAALGATLEIPTVEGMEPMEVPAGTQSGTELRLRGRGVPRLRGVGRGDLHVIVTVVVPPKPSKRERELLKELGDVGAPAVLPKGGPSLVDRLRDLFG
ncbi:MAG TPA: molecular chaperone DnaJ [Candidatus Limnocylindria bacterium]|jgi:molecular chaperone DnaJ|nr:molecular chaperone DnaJ [Candidatus Limnocylindria bacterium]